MAKDKMLVSQIITGQMLIKMTIRNQTCLTEQPSELSANSTWRREPGMTEFSFVFLQTDIGNSCLKGQAAQVITKRQEN